MEFGFEDLVGQVEREGGDALEQLKRAAAKSKEVAAMADALLDHFVQLGREAGLTWAQIGEVLNVSKQAAQQRGARLFKALSLKVKTGLRPHMPMFGRFTDKARASVVRAQEIARDLGHNYIGTEHLLVGALASGGVAAQALEHDFGVTAETVAEAIDEKVGRGAGTPEGHVPFTRKAKEVLELSLREAFQMGHSYIGTEHIVLSLMRGDEESVARMILEEAGVDPAALRATVMQLLEARKHPSQGEPGVEQA